MKNKQNIPLLNLLENRRRTLKQLSNETGLQESYLEKKIRELVDNGHDIRMSFSHKSGCLRYYKENEGTKKNVHVIGKNNNGEAKMTFAAASDMHFGNPQTDVQGFYDSMLSLEDSGISAVYVAGDILEGYGIYPKQKNKLKAVTPDEQTDIAAEILSKHKLKFVAIGGNHDIFKNQPEIDPLKILSGKIENFHYYGPRQADIIHNGVQITLLHSNSKNINIKPDVIILGHFHDFRDYKSCGTRIIRPGSYCRNGYFSRNGSNYRSGCCTVKLIYKNDRITKLTTRFVSSN